jgi:hypothetical protein
MADLLMRLATRQQNVSPMCASTADNAELRRGRLSRIGTVEGYLSLLLLVLLFVQPLLAPPLPEAYELPIGISLWAVAWLLSLSGTRHGLGFGRIAAGLSLSVLSLHALAVVYLLLGGGTIIHRNHP